MRIVTKLNGSISIYFFLDGSQSLQLDLCWADSRGRIFLKPLAGCALGPVWITCTLTCPLFHLRVHVFQSVATTIKDRLPSSDLEPQLFKGHTDGTSVAQGQPPIRYDNFGLAGVVVWDTFKSHGVQHSFSVISVLRVHYGLIVSIVVSLTSIWTSAPF